MLTKVRAYSSWQAAQELPLDDDGRPETDLLQIRKVEGLNPVDASINSIPSGTLDGESYSGSSVGRRNIVLTVKPNPDWDTWTYESLRQLIYSYFMPKLQVRLIFETEEIEPVEIYGYVESVEPDIFSKDGEIVISVICPQPHFTAVDPTVLAGTVGTPVTINYDGTIAAPYTLKVTYTSGAYPTWIRTEFGGLLSRYQQVETAVTEVKYFIANTVPGNKYVRRVNADNGVFLNLLPKIVPGSIWPTLEYGENDFSVTSDDGEQDWTLTYYKLYGGL